MEGPSDTSDAEEDPLTAGDNIEAAGPTTEAAPLDLQADDNYQSHVRLPPRNKTKGKHALLAMINIGGHGGFAKLLLSPRSKRLKHGQKQLIAMAVLTLR